MWCVRVNVGQLSLTHPSPPPPKIPIFYFFILVFPLIESADFFVKFLKIGILASKWWCSINAFTHWTQVSTSHVEREYDGIKLRFICNDSDFGKKSSVNIKPDWRRFFQRIINASIKIVLALIIIPQRENLEKTINRKRLKDRDLFLDREVQCLCCSFSRVIDSCFEK